MIIKIPADEIASSVIGTIKVFRGETDALFHFNISSTGFWRSFQAIWLILVPYLFAMLAERHSLMGKMQFDLDAFPSGHFFAVKLLTIALEWVLMPILLGFLAGLLDIRQTYASYIIVRNWASVVLTWVFFIPTLAYIAGFVPLEFLLVVQLGLLGVVAFLSFRIARATLQKSIQFCIVLVVVDFTAGLLLSRLLWLGLGPVEILTFAASQSAV